MKQEQMAVSEFMKGAGLYTETQPTICPFSTSFLRIQLIQEEINELTKAILENNLIEVADALGDLLYVILGAGNHWGIDMQKLFWEIHKSNMTKMVNGKLVINTATGKVAKPATYIAPDIKKCLEEMI